MIFIKWLVLVVLNAVMVVMGLPIVAIALLVGGVDERLPQRCQLWDNDREPWGDVKRSAAILNAHGIKKWWLRWVWLAVRNPANNFAYNIAGFEQSANVVYGNKGNSKTSDQGEAGWQWVSARVDGWLVAWELHWVRPYQNKKKCIRMRLGWKLDHNIDLPPIKDGSPAQLACVFNPVDTYNGI